MARVSALIATVRPWAQRWRVRAFAYEFLLFGLKQAWACLFGAAMLALIIGTHFAWPARAPIARYVIFCSHHYVVDIRWGLYAASVAMFARAWFTYTPDRKARRMPGLLGLVLVALFIWFAENIGTFTSAWIYPNQRDGWALVPIGKLGAWYLLILLSFVLVTIVHRPQAPGEGEPTNPLPAPYGRTRGPADGA